MKSKGCEKGKVCIHNASQAKFEVAEISADCVTMVMGKKKATTTPVNFFAEYTVSTAGAEAHNRTIFVLNVLGLLNVVFMSCCCLSVGFCLYLSSGCCFLLRLNTFLYVPECSHLANYSFKSAHIPSTDHTKH